MLARVWVTRILLVGMDNGTDALEKSETQFLMKLNMHLPYGLTILLLGIYVRKMETHVHTKTFIQVFITA